MLVSLMNGLHQVQSFGVYLDQGEDVPGLYRVAQCVQSGCVICILPLSKTLLCVFGCDEVFSNLPEGRLRGKSKVIYDV